MTNMESLHGGRFLSYLKKQSQFSGGQAGARHYWKGVYDNLMLERRRKNKANRSQFVPKGVDCGSLVYNPFG
jgi:hypothetical protein